MPAGVAGLREGVELRPEALGVGGRLRIDEHERVAGLHGEARDFPSPLVLRMPLRVRRGPAMDVRSQPLEQGQHDKGW